MKGFVGITDDDWIAFLSQQWRIDEGNNWQRGKRELFSHHKILLCKKMG
jgi:hypothetical protein